MSSLTYQDSGVDIDKANDFVKRIKPIANASSIPGVLSGIGGFGAMFELAIKKYKNPVLVSTTDGVGTKLKIASMLNKHDTIGIDLVAMCVNDLIVQGAKPLFFLDYYASSSLNTKLALAVISGIAKGCKQSGCALVGGETAEMPSMYKGEDYDLAGFCVGVVDKSKIIDSTKVSAGDHIIALASSGPHANGYSMIRKILKTANATNKELRAFIKPTKIYVNPILSLVEKFSIHAISHITGGGLIDNISRVLLAKLAANIDKNSWQMPSIFKWLRDKGNIDINEMYRVFNCGIGMVIILSAKDSQAATCYLNKLGEKAWLVGYVSKRVAKQVIIS